MRERNDLLASHEADGVSRLNMEVNLLIHHEIDEKRNLRTSRGKIFYFNKSMCVRMHVYMSVSVCICVHA